MNLRLNFYDLYGYVIPGLVALLLLYLPMAGQVELSLGWILVLLCSHPIGFVLHEVARDVLPSRISWDDGRQALPSARVADEAGAGLFASEDAREVVLHALTARGVAVPPSSERFTQLRHEVLRSGSGAYVEQMHGMQALSRTLYLVTASGAVGATGGAVVAFLGSPSIGSILLLGGFLGLLYALREGMEPLVQWAGKQTHRWPGFLLLLFAGGLAAPTSGLRGDLWGLVAIALVLATRPLRTAHPRYAKEFARAVYRGLVHLDATDGAGGAAPAD